MPRKKGVKFISIEKKRHAQIDAAELALSSLQREHRFQSQLQERLQAKLATFPHGFNAADEALQVPVCPSLSIRMWRGGRQASPPCPQLYLPSHACIIVTLDAPMRHNLSLPVLIPPCCLVTLLPC